MRRLRASGGTPIEEAPLWALALFTALLWLITWPALVGLLAGWGLWHGERLASAVGALAVAGGIVLGAATRRPWRRPDGPTPADPRPLFIRFSTWLWTTLIVPNVLFGTLVLTRPDPGMGYGGAWVVALVVSAAHAALAAVARWRRRRAAP